MNCGCTAIILVTFPDGHIEEANTVVEVGDGTKYEAVVKRKPVKEIE